MINNPKDINEIIDAIDNLSFEQLDEAVRSADEMSEEEIKQAFEVLNNGLDNPKVKSENCFYFNEYQMNTIKNMTYNLEKELAQEKEKNEKLEEEKEGFKRSYEIVMEEKANDYFLMNKVIDLMAEDLLRLDYHSEEVVKKYWSEVKEMYFKKARGEENE